MQKLLKKQGFAPEVLVTDKLRSYGAAKSEIGPSARHDQGLRANSWEFASADTTARARDAAFQIARIRPAFLVRSRRRPQHIQRPAPSHLPPHASRDLVRALNAIGARVPLMPSRTDLYFPVADNAADLPHLAQAALCPIPTIWGHRAGSPVENPQDLAFVRKAVQNWME
jgi:homoserine acetyltransferase